MRATDPNTHRRPVPFDDLPAYLAGGWQELKDAAHFCRERAQWITIVEWTGTSFPPLPRIPEAR